MKRSVKTEQRLERHLVFEVKVTAGTPALVYGKFRGTIAKNGTGDYTITLTNPSTQVVQAVATGYSADRLVTIGTRAATTVQVLVKDHTNTAQDDNFGLLVIANDGSDQY